MSLNKELQDYIKGHFTNSKLAEPLYFRGDYGLRFDLQDNSYEINLSNYLSEVNRRMNEIFKAITDNSDDIILYYNYHTWRKQKIRKGNYLLKQITSEPVRHQFKRSNYRRPINSLNGYHTCQLIIVEKLSNINFKNIFSAIANSDHKQNPKLAGELYIINKTNHTVTYMYDDRGCDVFSNNKNLVKEYYQKLSHLILEYDRDSILKSLA